MESTESKGIILKLGDIIQISAPNNKGLHDNIYFIDYIDDEKLIIINTETLKKEKLSITEKGNFTDESIETIILLSRSDKEGYARQNDLYPKTWINIYIGGDFPTVITGEITNLEEDMIEITTHPIVSVIYIDFAYKGIPEEIPIEKIEIRSKPSILVQKEEEEEEEEQEEEEEEENIPMKSKASIEYSKNGNMKINTPEKAKADENIDDVLKKKYVVADELIFGEELEEITQMVELPEGQKRYGVEIQANDLMDELLSTIPNIKRTKEVMENIHRLIQRFKQLRNQFSVFDNDGNVTNNVAFGKLYKPLIEKIKNFNINLKWIVPVVSHKKKLFNDIPQIDVINVNLADDLQMMDDITKQYKENSFLSNIDNENKYSNLYSKLNPYLTPQEPYEEENDENTFLTIKKEILENMDVVIDNLGDFISTVDTEMETRKKYAIHRYNLGLKKKDAKLMRNGKTVYVQNNLTPDDKITLKSLLVLPHIVSSYSKINLPNTNISERVNLHQNIFHMFRFLNKNKKINEQIVDDFTKEISYDENFEFLNSARNFSLDENLKNENDKFEKYLNSIIPQTNILIDDILKKNKYNVSTEEIISLLEPFAIYREYINYNHYKKIRYFVKNGIIDYKKKLFENSKLFDKQKEFIKRNTNEPVNNIRNILSNKKELYNMFIDAYKMNDEFIKKINTSELYNNLLKIDNIKMLLNIVIFMTVKNLKTPNELIDNFQEKKIDDLSELEKIRPRNCNLRYLTKKYYSIRELQNDNNKYDVYYDKDMDDTQYEILENFKKEKKMMEPTNFFEFLKENLRSKYNVRENDLEGFAKTLVEGKKRVKDGEYAILLLYKGDNQNIEINYYKRLKNQWIPDDTLSKDDIFISNDVFCNFSNECLKNEKNKMCEEVDFKKMMMQNLKNKKINEDMETRVSITIGQLDVYIKSIIENDFKKNHNSFNLNRLQQNKYNNIKYYLGTYINSDEENATILVSPHQKIRDVILSQEDFTKKQNDIYKFVKLYCREPMIEQLKEDPHWLYCKETNTKLFPQSLYKLAETFVLGGDYMQKLYQICRTNGVLSDDGDAIVDMYSGYTLRKIDYVTEEMFTEEGIKIKTHEIMEKDLNVIINEMFQKKVINKPNFENKLNEVIYNITETLCDNMGLPLEDIQDFVISITIEEMNKLITNKEKYDRIAATKKKKQIPYDIYKNRMMFWIISCCVIISIQTAIPSFNTKKGFPGCVRSFAGFPLSGGIENTSFINYFACVLKKLKSGVSPWNSIEKINIEEYEKGIKDVMERIIIRQDINERFLKKREYILLHPDDIIPEEHSISKWVSYLPPIVDVSLKQLNTITEQFEKELVDLIKNGNKKQRTMINIIKGKNILFGYGIIGIINEIVKKKDLLLKTSGNIYFIENACCNDSDLIKPIEYFTREETLLTTAKIEQYLNNIIKNRELINEIYQYSNPHILFHSPFTGQLRKNITEGKNIFEENIYKTIIYYCNYDNDYPVPIFFEKICNKKPEGYNKNWDIYEKISFLKRNDKYGDFEDTYKKFNELMNIVREKNIIKIKELQYFTQINVLNDLLEKYDKYDSEIIEKDFRILLRNLLKNYNPTRYLSENTKELNDFKDYLKQMNDNMFSEINYFLKKFGKQTKKKDKMIEDYLKNIFNYGNNMEKTAHIHIFKKNIENSIFMMIKMCPEMIINEKYYNFIPKSWEISNIHQGNLKKIIEEYWEKTKRFYGDKLIIKMLSKAQTYLMDILMLIQEIPIYSQITKNESTFYSLFDEETIFYLYDYCLYSTFYGYITLANDDTLLATDEEEKKKNIRQQMKNYEDVSQQMTGSYSIEEENEEIINELEEMDIRQGNMDEYKQRVASLLVIFIDLQMNDNNNSLSYEEISEKIRKNKNEEKRKIINKLGNLSKDERAIEDMFKRYKMGDWNIGQQKGLVKYDKNFYDKEIENMENIESDNEPKNTLQEQDLEEIMNEPDFKDDNYDTNEDSEGNDINQYGNDYYDGTYYPEDRDPDDIID